MRSHRIHGGALRGWRSHRLHLAAERISIVVLFNHHGRSAGRRALEALPRRTRREEARSRIHRCRRPHGSASIVEPETGLAARIDTFAPGEVRLRFGHSAPERLRLQADGSATSGRVTLRGESDALWLERPAENLRTKLLPVATDAAPRDIAGRYRCDEIDAEIAIVEVGGVLHGACIGALGQGRMERLESIAPDLWALPCPRALDVSPPGDWTLAFRRDDAGRIAGATVGCWLARGLDYPRVA
jgi:D-aminopeptidase